jgi:hypothetical protein
MCPFKRKLLQFRKILHNTKYFLKVLQIIFSEFDNPKLFQISQFVDGINLVSVRIEFLKVVALLYPNQAANLIIAYFENFESNKRGNPGERCQAVGGQIKLFEHDHFGEAEVFALVEEGEALAV